MTNPAAILPDDIRVMRLSARTRNALLRAGINRITTLRETTLGELLNIPNFGKGCATEMFNELIRLDLQRTLVRLCEQAIDEEMNAS